MGKLRPLTRDSIIDFLPKSQDTRQVLIDFNWDGDQVKNLGVDPRDVDVRLVNRQGLIGERGGDFLEGRDVEAGIAQGPGNELSASRAVAHEIGPDLKE